MVDLAWKSLLHDRIRFAITVLGVAFSVTLVFVQVGLFFGLLDNATVTIEHVPADLWVTSRNCPNVDFAHTFPETHVQRVRSIPGVARADNLIVWFQQVALPTGAQEGMQVYALEDLGRWNLPWKVLEGDVSDLRRGPYFFLDDSATKRYGPFAVGQYREVFGQRLKIIGRTAEAKSFTTTPLAFMDYRVVQSLNPSVLKGQTNYVLVQLESGANVEQVRAEIRRRLPFNDVYTKKEWAARSKNYWIQSTGLGLNMILTILLGCLVGVIVVAQTLYTQTMEHLREFGTVKAIGGSDWDIYKILGRQATIAAVIGYAIGLVPSFGMIPIVRDVGLKLLVPPELTVAVFFGTLVLCLGASAVSFRKVASIDPALVFRV